MNAIPASVEMMQKGVFNFEEKTANLPTPISPSFGDQRGARNSPPPSGACY